MLKAIALNGIDNHTKAKDVEALYRDYPFVEFGVLVSDKNTNRNINPRYPSLVMLKAYRNLGIPLTLHVCGGLAGGIVRENQWEPLRQLMGGYMELFGKIQLNVGHVQHFSKQLTFPEGVTTILQMNRANQAVFEYYQGTPGVCGLQDGSGGTGTAEEAWMEPVGSYFGYAGGIGPENVVDTIRQIEQLCGVDFFIDMESKIRRNDKFDIAKCRQVCAAVVKQGLISM